MFFTSYSLMLKAFSPLFFLPCVLSVAPHSAIAPESAAVLSLSSRLCSLQLVLWFSMYFFFSSFILR